MKAVATPIVATFAASIALLMAGTASAKTPDVVVSIKPIHSLVASIMKGVAEPKLIVEGAASPHTYSMKPSNARAIQNADLIFWMGPNMEAFLDKPLDALAGTKTVVALSDAPDLQKLPFREGGPFEAHDHGDGHGHDHGHDHAHEGEHDDPAKGEDAHEPGHDHEHGGFDPHVWLDPINAKVLGREIAKRLVEADPEHAKQYEDNAANLMRQIDELDAEIKTTVAPVKDKPFIVFHDAYQYFEKRYDVTVAGSITVSPESLPGADRISQIHKKVTELGATCVFAEPQFTPKLVNVVLEGTPAKAGTLDPEAATLKEGPDLYFQLMRGIAESMKTCLSDKG
ncbi:zinc ABC transporter substrate-binding protein ZnuA [Rhizobiales bacterium RZME27]|uniref:High-affinity zinc uptake system protein ZnuA n=1 Tax=Endobacterium cereale TaxID=2663029 RepID=A0A6A8AC64_9HYPH|nr:zinc ABC transporter substrate-binding protein ZnuA [Endobacterium cereale]MEB2843352.1 zinc ABC transporter substrate-binding protein ZnuA [Endobacterium cereale]MQY47310.1 zinc ABC transporter substrate-binding protein ZnuA [Endobacterium cereale]